MELETERQRRISDGGLVGWESAGARPPAAVTEQESAGGRLAAGAAVGTLESLCLQST